MTIEKLMKLEEITREDYDSFIEKTAHKSYILSSPMSSSSYYMMTDHYGWENGDHVIYARKKKIFNIDTQELIEEKYFLRKL